MQIRELSVPDSYEVIPEVIEDTRGVFLEWYRFDRLAEKVGHSLDLRQGNMSVSRRGVLRGIHFADVPRGQAKYVTVAHGAVLDFVVDVRRDSPTFGRWDSVLLDSKEHRAVYLAEGLGHAFVALTDEATVSYLVSDIYSPANERGINPLDDEVGLEIPASIGTPIVSDKDRLAPGLRHAMADGILPSHAEARARYAELDERAH